uniref:SAP domain-containing protein n=1 Tax=Ditylenchus dipsaci TaxID=166011 RepID=A0A915E4L6_9BILA
MEELREKLNALSWNDLRHEAKKHSVKAKGKKTELIESILKTIGDATEPTSQQTDVKRDEPNEFEHRQTPNEERSTKPTEATAEAVTSSGKIVETIEAEPAEDRSPAETNEAEPAVDKSPAETSEAEPAVDKSPVEIAEPVEKTNQVELPGVVSLETIETETVAAESLIVTNKLSEKETQEDEQTAKSEPSASPAKTNESILLEPLPVSQSPSKTDEPMEEAAQQTEQPTENQVRSEPFRNLESSQAGSEPQQMEQPIEVKEQFNESPAKVSETSPKAAEAMDASSPTEPEPSLSRLELQKEASECVVVAEMPSEQTLSETNGPKSANQSHNAEQYLSEDNDSNGALDTTYTKEDVNNSLLSQDISLPPVGESFLTEDNSPRPNISMKIPAMEQSQDEPMDTMDLIEEETINAMKSVEEAVQPEEAVKSEEPIENINQPAEAVELAATEEINQLVPNPDAPKESTLLYTSPSPFITKKSPAPFNRFAKQHQKEFNLMPSIWDTEAKLKELHAKNNSAIPSRIKQLASPKKLVSPKKALVERSIKLREEIPLEAQPRCSAIKQPNGSSQEKMEEIQNTLSPKKQCSITNQNIKDNEENVQFSPPKDPNVISFKFGSVDVNDIAKVQKPFSSVASSTKFVSRLKMPMPVYLDKRDVKQRTMSTCSPRLTVRTPPRFIRLATTPVMSHRLEKLATPKGQVPEFDSNSEDESGSLAKRYTPYSGRFEYKDTTNMNDKELQEYNMSKRQHQYQKQPY